MRVLVACEYSGRVRDAFIKRGHDALSCDLLPTDVAGPHYQGDVMDLLQPGRWDLMIAHPPCTDLAVSGALYFKEKIADGRQPAAIYFFWQLLNAPVPLICVENPVGVISTAIRKPTQYVQPWQYGHEETKKTGLWLKGLPCLTPTAIMEKRDRNLTPSGQNKLGPSPDRWKLRSATYQGIADAMADQWGTFALAQKARGF